MAVPARPRSGITRQVRRGLLVLLATPVLVAGEALAASPTTTPAATGATSVGSEYGWVSFLFFLLVVGGGVWLWHRRAR